MNEKDGNQPQNCTQADRECMEFDIVIVGAGPAGLSCACHLAQLAKKANNEFSICVVEKAAQVGAHIVSGAVFETSALDELFPDWPNSNAPFKTSCYRRSLTLSHDRSKPHQYTQNTYTKTTA